MINVNVYKIFNQTDKKYFSIYIEWFESHFNVMLFESNIRPLRGEMNTKDIEYFSNELSKSSNEYLQETKEIFSGNDKEVQYFIQNEMLEWKKNVWTLGTIKLYPILDINILSESFQQFLNIYQIIQGKLNSLETENKYLMDTKIKLSQDIEEMIKIKTSMEQDLYKKCMLIINSKKEKLRKMQNLLKREKSTEGSIFDACTDESEQSGEEDHKINSKRRIRTKTQKRKTISNPNLESVMKTRKSDLATSAASTVNEKILDSENLANNSIQVPENTESVVSEHESIHKVQHCVSGTRKSRSSLNFTEEDSEDELFSS